MTVHVPRLPSSLDPLIAEAKRRMRKRRLLVVVVAVLLAGAATVTAFALHSPNGSGGPSGATVSGSASNGLASGRVSGLQYSYPHHYHARPFTTCRFAITGDRKNGCESGVVIASYPLKPQPEIGGSGAHFAGNGVALQLYRPPADNGLANVKLGNHRLSLWQFMADGNEGFTAPGHKPPPPEQWSAWFRANGASYWAIAWVGNGATKPDRTTLASIINSVHTHGLNPRAPATKPSPQVTRVLCTGTTNSPRVPGDALAGGYGHICAQLSGTKCTVWTREIGAPPGDVHERHLGLRKNFCNYARRFVTNNPHGYSSQPVRPGLTGLLKPSQP